MISKLIHVEKIYQQLTTAVSTDVETIILYTIQSLLLFTMCKIEELLYIVTCQNGKHNR